MSEVASAYVSLIPSFRGGANRIGDELGPASEQAGQQSGRRFGSSMLSSFTKLGIGGAIAGIFAGAVSSSANQAELSAKLGLSPKQAKTAATVAGRLYAGSFADDMGEINDAIKVVSQNLSGVGNGKQLQSLTGQALSLSKAFGVDVAGTVGAASQLMRTGLAKNAQEAFDLIATGEQNGADKAGDLLDTFNEYGTQFRKLGIDGPHALGLIQQGLQGGARDSDKVADAIKEFSIRAIDGSVLTAQGFASIGLNARTMSDTIGKGGPAASAALSLVLDRLRGMKDPAKQAQTAVALFGAQSEDLGSALFKLNPKTALTAKGMQNISGASKRVTADMGKTTPPFEALKRQAMSVFTAIGSNLVPVVKPFLALMRSAGKPLAYVALALAGVAVAAKAATAVSSFASTVSGAVKGVVTFTRVLTGSTIATEGNSAAQAANTVRTVASRVATVAASAATKAWAAAQWLINAAMSANPIGIVVVAIVALVAIVIVAYKRFGWFRDLVRAVWTAIRKAASAAWGALKAVFGALRAALGVVAAAFKLYFNIYRTIVVTVFKVIRATITTVINAVKAIVRNGLSAVSGVIRSVGSTIRNVWSGVWNAVRTAVSRVWTGIKSLVRNSIGAVWTTIANVGSKISGAWSRIWNGIRTTVTTVVKSISGIVSGVWDDVTSGLRGVVNGGISIINSAIGGINHLIDIANRVPFVNIPHIDPIPQLAKGGIIPATPGGQLVNVAEKGHAEAVIPLDRWKDFVGGSDRDGRTAPVVAGDLVIQQVSDPVTTARATVRRLSRLGSA